MSVATAPWRVCRRPTAILADGAFPEHPVPRAALRAAARIVCCDGAAAALAAAGLEPAAVVGDLDSLSAALRARFAACLHRDPSQEDNDLAKAFRFCLARGWRTLVILGAGGKREDHLLGNLGHLADFAALADVVLLTECGVFQALAPRGTLASFPGQAVSFFTLDPRTRLTVRGVRYPVRRLRLAGWWQGTLNEATGTRIEVAAEGGPALVFQSYPRRRKERRKGACG